MTKARTSGNGRTQVQVDVGKLRVVSGERAQAADEQRDGGSHPHDPVAEEAVCQSTLFLTVDHRPPYLGKRIGQALALHPLATQDHGGAHHAGVERQQEYPPPQQRLDPCAVRNRAPCRLDPLIEGAILIPIVHHDGAVREVRKQLLRPVVFRRGIVEERRQDRQQLIAQAHRAQSADDQQHDVDEDELRTIERQTRAAQGQRQVEDRRYDEKGVEQDARRVRIEIIQRPVPGQETADRERCHGECCKHMPRSELEHDVEPADEDQEQEDGARRVEVEGHEGRVHDHAGVGRADGEKETEKGPGPEAAPGQTRSALLTHRPSGIHSRVEERLIRGRDHAFHGVLAGF